MAKNYKGIGKGRYKATSGKRKGKVFTMGKGGSHVYKKGRKTVTIHKGGRRTVSVSKGKPKPADTFNPLAPRTGKQYESELKAATELEFGDTERELATQRRNTGQHMTNVGDWWGGYQRDLEAARQRQLQGSLMAAGMVQNQANKGFGQDAMQAVGMDLRNKQEAATRGATTDPTLGAQAMQAASLNRTQTAQFGGVIGGQAAAQNRLMADRGAIAGGQRAQALENVRSQQGKLDEEGRAIATKKGAFKQKFRSETIDKERQYAAVQQEFGLDVAAEKAKQADKAADNAAQRKRDAQNKRNQQSLAKDRDRRYQETLREHGRQQAEREWKRNHPAKGSKGRKGAAKFTPTQKRANKNSFHKQVSNIQTAREKSGASTHKLLKGNYSKWSKIVLRRLVGSGVDRDIAVAAIRKAGGQSISPKMRKRLKKMGFDPGPGRKRGPYGSYG